MIPKLVQNIIQEIVNCINFLNNLEYENRNAAIRTGKTIPKRINQNTSLREGTETASRKAKAP
jgi:phage-related protein